jgi:hypothetical protein
VALSGADGRLRVVVQAVNETREWIIAGATVAAALGTLAAVLVALYRETWREWRSRPRLTLDLDPTWSERNLDLFWQQGSSPAHWARLRVSNATGRRSAHDVEVLVTAFYTVDQEEEDWQPPLDTRPLPWSNTPPVDGAEVTEAQIPPGVSRHLDVLQFPAPVLSDGGGGYSPADPKDGARTHGYLRVVPDPTDLRNRLVENHRYRINLAVTARDLDSRAYVMKVEFDGAYRWPAEFWGGMTLTLQEG